MNDASAVSGGHAPHPEELTLHIEDRAMLYACYMSWVEAGGVFVPTQKVFKLDMSVFVQLSLLDDPNIFSVLSKVVWITPEGANRHRVQGIGVQFSKDPAGVNAKKRIEEILGTMLSEHRTSHPTHTL